MAQHKSAQCGYYRQSGRGDRGFAHAPAAPWIQHAWYRFYTFLRPERLRPDWSRDRIIAEINGAGVACFSGSCSEIYLEKAFTDIGMAPAQPLPDARELGETSLAFLVDPALDTAAMEKAAHVLREVFARASIGRPALDAARR